jgi:hypothetical protein
MENTVITKVPSWYRSYVYYKYLLLSAVVWKIQKLIMHLILKLRQPTRPFEISKQVLNKNHALQAELLSIFQNYTVCSRCERHCCDGGLNRMSSFDCYILGIDFSEGEFTYNELTDLFRRVKNKIFKRKKIAKTQEPASRNSAQVSEKVCAHLGYRGCRLSAGYRPMSCTEFLCVPFINAFSREDLKRYSSLNGRYARFRTTLMFSLMGKVLKEQLG